VKYTSKQLNNVKEVVAPPKPNVKNKLKADKKVKNKQTTAKRPAYLLPNK
jgi:hypothetical protein